MTIKNLGFHCKLIEKFCIIQYLPDLLMPCIAGAVLALPCVRRLITLRAEAISESSPFLAAAGADLHVSLRNSTTGKDI